MPFWLKSYFYINSFVLLYIKIIKHYVSLYPSILLDTFLRNTKIMFGLFKKKSEKDKLRSQYEKLLKEAHSLSTTNRKMSDQKAFEADEVMKKIEQLS